MQFSEWGTRLIWEPSELLLMKVWSSDNIRATINRKRCLHRPPCAQGSKWTHKLANTFGVKHKVAMDDHALHDISYGESFPWLWRRNLTVMFGQFHIAGNVMGVFGKTMWNSDAEDILIETGLCKQGMANNIFSSAGYARAQITTGGNG